MQVLDKVFQEKLVCVCLGLITPVIMLWNNNHGRDQPKNTHHGRYNKEMEKKNLPEVVTPYPHARDQGEAPPSRP